jgi:ribonuclease HI
LVNRAHESLSEFQEAQDREQQLPQQSGSAEIVKWNPLAQGRYKVNYDGAVFSDSNAAGIGVIVRNHQGEVMGSLSQRIPFPHSVEALEASAARSAIQFAKDLGFTKIVLEGDSKTVVDAFLLRDPCTTIYGHIIEDIKQTAQSLQSVLFLHTKREGNVMAHLLAKRAHQNKPFEAWLESVPSELVSKLCTDFPS